MVSVRHNRLITENSPYLLQHAYNPLDWYPWGDEAFERAKKLDRPIFLSIGYSSCHWCHEMERECFEDDEVAEALNADFVNIKVDREERPDIDALYMKACQILTGRGGWPLSIFITPDRKPFYAATFIPKNSKYGIPGMMDILPTIVRIWKERREDIYQIAEMVSGSLERNDIDTAECKLEQFDRYVFEGLLTTFEEKYGGFEVAPKFPSPHKAMFLLRYWSTTTDQRAYSMAEYTLRRVCLGGIRDHLGGGFHRYSTDRRWKVPHFEKMLYDQALLSIALTEMFQASNDPLFREAAIETIDYVLKNLRDKNGGFFSSEDADGPNGEGAYYTWTLREIDEILEKEEAVLIKDIYDLREKGNFRSDEGRLDGRNIFHMERDIREYCRIKGLNELDVVALLNRAKLSLKKARGKRQRPALDDKILLDWNGLMIAALSKAGRVLEISDYIDEAERCVWFIEKNMVAGDGKLLHRYREGRSGINAFLTDYSYYAWGLIELNQATMKEQYLELASKRAIEMNEIFSEPEGGFVISREKDMIAKEMEVYDGAIPSGNSVAIYVNTLLSTISEGSFKKFAEKAIKRLSGEVTVHPEAHSFFAISAILHRDGVTSINVGKEHGMPGSEIRKMVDRAPFFDVIISVQKEDELIKGTMGQVCSSRTCLSPFENIEELNLQLKREKRKAGGFTSDKVKGS
ncbi:MAG: thioredoxin domain-containing protein [Methanomassiliicoccales archaeon]|nr:MAG: thioredoxin domain-containing protein [Methanomassiliicoccales archaeon]